MEWSRIKTILILFMLVVNGFLLGVYAIRQKDAGSVTRRSAEDLAALLENRGVSIDLSAIPDDSQRLYILEYKRDENLENAAAGRLLENPVKEDQGGNIFVYTGDNGRATFRSGGNMEIALTSPVRGSGAKPEKSAVELLSAMGFDVSKAGVSAEDNGPGETVRVSQYKQGLPVFNCRVELSYDGDGGLTGLSGRWASGTEERSGSQQSKSSAFALISFVDKMKSANTPVSSITRVELGYIAATAAPGYLRLLPVWLITADGKDSYVNALTGLPEMA